MLVIGTGNSGSDIAVDISRVAERVLIQTSQTSRALIQTFDS